MAKKLSILNLLLIFVASILAVWIIRIWVKPDFPSHIDGNSLIGSPRSLQEFSTNRKTYSQNLISQVMAQNLFRKERIEFKIDLPKSKTEIAIVPPPEIVVKGIIILQNTKMAVLTGDYFVPGDNNKPEKKPIKRKGYLLNEYIGSFQIVRIEKNLVELNGPQEATLTLYLKHQSNTPIQREANRLYYKKRKKKENSEVSGLESVQSKNNLQQEPIIQEASEPDSSSSSKASNITKPQNVPVIQPRLKIQVSGVSQNQVSLPTRAISGTRTNKKPIRPHISGR